MTSREREKIVNITVNIFGAFLVVYNSGILNMNLTLALQLCHYWIPSSAWDDDYSKRYYKNAANLYSSFCSILHTTSN